MLQAIRKTLATMPVLPKMPPRTTSPARVFYEQPSGVKADLMPLYQEFAKKLDITPAALRAFAVVESDEKAFTVGGKPVVRFEPAHWKKRRIASKASMAFDAAKNSLDLDKRWAQFEAMRQVNEIAAILSHSFGLFQIMGFNHERCLCASPAVFLKEQETVTGQFKLFQRFLLSNPPLLAAIRKARADQVGLHMNGPQYQRNKYDIKWAAASKSGGSLVWV